MHGKQECSMPESWSLWGARTFLFDWSQGTKQTAVRNGWTFEFVIQERQGDCGIIVYIGKRNLNEKLAKD
jgi:hypothetical protein